ncbi:MAG TPA: peptidoglycan DD-metalloendopeptidase family protein [bacterium]|nr:peptidoglycan DD-metalloendopeptidase family protein [bacterium]
MKISNIQNFIILLVLIPILLNAQQDSTVSAPQATPGPSVHQIKKKLSQNKKNLAAIQKQLKQKQLEQKQSEVKERNVLTRLQKVDQTLGKLKREKEANQQDLEETRRRIDGLQGAMKSNRDQLSTSRQLLKRRLQALFRMSFRTPFLGGLLDAESFGDFARKLNFEMTLARSNEKLLSQTVQQQEKLEEDSAQWSHEEHRKKRIVDVLGRQERNYSSERKNRTVFLTSIRKKQALREQAISELNAQAQELQSKVSFFLQQAEEAKKRSVYVPAGKGLRVSRGSIPWPVSGTILPDYAFGKHKNKEFNAVVDNSGVQIQAPPGTPIKAIAEGRVRYADWFKGYGKLVILDHGEGYYSLYAQASDLTVSEGDRVVPGQVIGTVGDTGSLVGSSLYFEIRKNGVPQDPVRWLARH